MKTETARGTLPQEAILKILAEAVADYLNENMIDLMSDAICEATEEAVKTHLGSIDDEEYLMELAMEMSGRVSWTSH